jgi:hypothetical protein
MLRGIIILLVLCYLKASLIVVSIDVVVVVRFDGGMV